MPRPIPPVAPPAPETYGRVLRRYDRAPGFPARFASYDVNLKSIPVEMDGRVARTLFFPRGKEAAAARACKVGWLDVTERWAAFLRGEPLATTRRAPATSIPASAPATSTATRPESGIEFSSGVAPIKGKGRAPARA